MLLLTLTSCGGSDGPGGTGPGASGGTTLSISQTSVTMSFLGETVTLTAALRDQNGQPASGSISWSVDNSSVVTVVAGLLTALQNGTATVTVSSGSLSKPVAVTVQQLATQITIVSGGGQSATVGQALGEAVVTRAADAGGTVVEAASLRFVVSSGGGSVGDSAVATDAQGLASTTWTLGTVAGPQQIDVSVAGATSVLLQVSATGLAAAADSLVKSSGDLQSGAVDQPLSEAIVVQLQDEFGNGVAGGEVTFAITGGGGAVSAETVTTNSDGFAQTTWTMGPAVGADTLTATALGIPAVTFTATAVVPMPDLVVGEMSVSPASPTSLQTVTVTVPVTNSGTATPGASFSVQLLVDGVEAATQTVAPIAPAATSNVVLAAGPFAAGTHAFSVVVDVGGVIAELDESNNTAQQSVDVLAQAALEVGTPINGISAEMDVELLFAFELTAEDGSIEFRLDGDTIQDADIYVKYGSVPQPPLGLEYEARPSYGTCKGITPFSNETCRINGAQTGTYHILVHAFEAFSNITLSVTTGLEVLTYDIELSFVDSPTSTQRDVFEAAVERWQGILPYDILDLSFAASPQAAGTCLPWLPAIDDVVDDVRIYIKLDSIDGVGGTVGFAGPCLVRASSSLPVIGLMQFDTADLRQLEFAGFLSSVILHEMGHVLGIGTLWEQEAIDLLRNPSIQNPGADTHFIGPLAISAFDAAGGTGYTAGGKVPVHNDGQAGRTDGHWRESVFADELMTPDLESGFEPLSAISIQSLADVGYRVDVSRADSYTLPFLNAARVRRPGAVIDLGNDIWIGPIIGVDPRGRVERIKRR